MFLLIGSFIAGMITVLAPCVLPLLPIIIGGSISGKVQDKKRPLIIAASLAVSLILFTVLLKATTLFINIPPETFTIISGVILIVLGIALFFPNIYDAVIIKLNLQAKSQQLLGKAGGKGSTVGAIITGAALGPVFSSCSPVYAYILATVLPANFGLAMLYIVAYVLGLSLMLLLIGYLGQRFLKRIKFLSNPKGWFMRAIALLFIIVGLLIMTGYDKKFQTYVSEKTPFDFDGLSAQLIPNATKTTEGILNVEKKKAPEFVGLKDWINSSPKKLSDYKGKVVLIDFWTYSCINCIRTQPYLKEWYSTYKDSGFEIIGVHAPEFAFERIPANVEKATKAAGLEYPIALDNDFATWNAYGNQFWPGSYLIDKDGNIRRYHGGEGEYTETEEAIRTLLAEKGGKVPGVMTNAINGKPPVRTDQTPETYLGTKRASNYRGTPGLLKGSASFTPAKLDRTNDWTLGGKWNIDSEGITAEGDSTITIQFAAKDLYLVTANDVSDKKLGVKLNGTPISSTGSAGDDVKDSMVSLSSAQLYKLVKYNSFKKGDMLELQVPTGVKLNVFTFGS
jgi:cytochrome c biogenesis protein CcdA/thiol-disulfide isomerase/thioredoxin